MRYLPTGPFRGVPKGTLMPFPEHRDMQEVNTDERRKERCMCCGGKPMKGYAICFDCQPKRA